MDEPFSDSSLSPRIYFLVSRQTVTVAWGGDGGDDCLPATRCSRPSLGRVYAKSLVPAHGVCRTFSKVRFREDEKPFVDITPAIHHGRKYDRVTAITLVGSFAPDEQQNC